MRIGGRNALFHAGAVIIAIGKRNEDVGARVPAASTSISAAAAGTESMRELPLIAVFIRSVDTVRHTPTAVLARAGFFRGILTRSRAAVATVVLARRGVLVAVAEPVSDELRVAVCRTWILARPCG